MNHGRQDGEVGAPIPRPGEPQRSDQPVHEQQNPAEPGDTVSGVLEGLLEGTDLVASVLASIFE